MLDTCEWLEGRGTEVTRLAVGPDGLIELGALEAVLDERVLLVAAMLVNNEIGVIQPVAEIAEAAHRAGALMLCDAVQGLGRMPIPHGPDLVAVSAHKVHGPKGIGALWIREGAEPATLAMAGGMRCSARRVAGAVASVLEPRNLAWSAPPDQGNRSAVACGHAALSPEWAHRSDDIATHFNSNSAARAGFGAAGLACANAFRRIACARLGRPSQCCARSDF